MLFGGVMVTTSLGPMAYTTKKNIHKFQVIQNRAALTITGADRHTRTTQLHEMLNLDKIQTRITQLARKTKETYTNHDNTLIQQIAQSQDSTKLHYRRPTQRPLSPTSPYLTLKLVCWRRFWSPSDWPVWLPWGAVSHRFNFFFVFFSVSDHVHNF